MRAIKKMKLISLANTKFYPGKEEFHSFCPDIPSILIVPINNKAFILIGGWSANVLQNQMKNGFLIGQKINDIF